MKTEARYFIVKEPASDAENDGIELNCRQRKDCQTFTVHSGNGLPRGLLEHGPYLVSGKPDEDKCWMIHISIVQQEFNAFFNPIFNFLANLHQTFAFPSNAEQHRRILDGRAGLPNVGKVITVQLRDEILAAQILSFLIPITENLKGPAVPGGIHLENCIYVTYGTFLTQPPFATKSVSRVFRSESILNLQHRIRRGELRWPFCDHAFAYRKPQRLLKRQYLPVATLKIDPKGNVFKAIKLNKLYNAQWCVLKQGNRYHCFDDRGRDIVDRLRWQLKLHEKLRGLSFMPNALELFVHDGNAYLVLDYIEGRSLNDWILGICSGTCLMSLTESRQQSLLHVLEQLVKVVTTLHSYGYIHRDLNPENIMITPEGKLYLTDFELCYSLSADSPVPPFSLGTHGYMSPQQRGGFAPAPADDIYALGGIFIKFFSGLSPLKFDTANLQRLSGQLSFFLPDTKLRKLIVDCFDASPEKRPALGSLLDAVHLFQSKLMLKTIHRDIRNPNILYETIPIDPAYELQMLQTATKSKKKEEPGISCDLANGDAGIYYTAAHTKVPEFFGLISPEWTALEAGRVGINEGTASGLFHGPEGLAFLFAECAGAGCKSEGSFPEAFLSRMMMKEPLEHFGIAEGSSGQGISLIRNLQVWPVKGGDELLRHIAIRLVRHQLRDGSWLVKKQEAGRKGTKIPGLFHGIAGITLFLMMYAGFVQESYAKTAARKALEYLAGQRRACNGHLIWTLYADTSEVNPWLEDGFTGLAFLFIRAYALFRDEHYERIASAALMAHPENISSNFLSLSNGLAGLGEVYLEAYKVFGGEEWKNRAEWIAQLLYHTGHHSEGHIWDADESGNYPKGLLNGKAGILHFLARCNDPQKINFPIFS